MIDARGRSCPEPVLILKKALESGDDSYTILVDCAPALENITRYASSKNYEVSYKEDNGEYSIELKRK